LNQVLSALNVVGWMLIVRDLRKIDWFDKAVGWEVRTSNIRYELLKVLKVARVVSQV
jgi:hypothetical protein